VEGKIVYGKERFLSFPSLVPIIRGRKESFSVGPATKYLPSKIGKKVERRVFIL